MNSYRFSPIENKEALIEAVKYIASQTSALSHKIIDKSFPITSLTIFAHSDDEYSRLIKILSELGSPYNENNGPRVLLHEPIVAGENVITHLRIRKPDPERPQAGCNDFDTDYEAFKKDYLTIRSSNLRLIERTDYEMIELFDTDLDVLAYIVSEGIREKVQKLLGKEVVQFSLFGKGAVNNAYLAETADGEKYIIKQEKAVKEFQPQNTLLIEAHIAQELDKVQLSIPVPKIAFICENPMMYGYHYIEGELMIAIWESLNEEERINTCRKLGGFHAEIGKKITKEAGAKMGVVINDSVGLHPETVKDNSLILKSNDVPDDWKALAQQAKDVFDNTADKTVFQFIHNDSHHENIIVQNKKIVGIIDFGEAEYGEVAKEFSRYIRDYPDYFKHIVAAYEEASGNSLSYERLVSNAFLSGFIDIVESYRRGGEDRAGAEKAIAIYRKLLG